MVRSVASIFYALGVGTVFLYGVEVLQFPVVREAMDNPCGTLIKAGLAYLVWSTLIFSILYFGLKGIKPTKPGVERMALVSLLVGIALSILLYLESTDAPSSLFFLTKECW